MSSGSAPARSARTVRCRGCAGTVPVETLTPSVRCPHCGLDQLLDDATLRELEGYRARSAERLEQARSELQQVAGWQHLAGRPGTSPAVAVLVGFGLMALLPTVVSIAIALGVQHGALPEQAYPFVGLGAVGAAMVGVVVFVVWYHGGRRSEVAVAGPRATAVSCPSCGAPSSLGPGQALARCAYCGAALMPTETVMQAGLAAAWEVVRTAQMRRFRAERSGMVRVSRYNMANAVPYLVLGSLTLMTLPLTALVGLQMLRGEEPYDPMILGMVGLALGLCGGLVALPLVRRARRNRWQCVAEEIAARFGGQVLDRVEGMTAWLDAFWAGPYAPTDLVMGPVARGVAATVQGYPTLVVVDPVAQASGSRYSPGPPAKVQVLVAAWIPGLSDGTDSALRHGAERGELVGWLGSQRFVLEYNQAGLMARASPDLVAGMRRRPEGTRVVPDVAACLARIARGLGASPVAPIP